jgi:hypothetical protein
MTKKTVGAIVSTILGSSVIGALVGAWATHRYDAAAIADQNNRLHKSEQRELYTSLGKDIQKLQSDVQSAVITVSYSAAHPKDKNFSMNIERSIDVVSEQMAVISQLVLSPQIEVSLREAINELMNELGPKLRDIQNNKRQAASLIYLYNQSLKQRFEKIQSNIETKRTELPIVK